MQEGASLTPYTPAGECPSPGPCIISEEVASLSNIYLILYTEWMKPQITIILVCVSAIVIRFITLPEVQAHFRRPDTGRPFPFAFHSAKLGDRVMLPGVKPIPGSKSDVLLVLCGECMSCAVNAVDPATIDTAKYGRVVLIFSTPYQDIPKPFKKLGPAVAVIGDPQNSVFRELDAGGTPHYYLLTSDLKIKQDQKSVYEKPDFLIRRRA